MKYKIIGLIKYILLFVTFVLLLSNFKCAVVDGSSMESTLSDGDFLFLRVSKNIENGDIIAIDSKDVGKILCKRVIGTSGDKIKISDGKLFVNDIELTEDYVKEKDWGTYTEDMEYSVDKGSIFVLGDNRNNSLDSRDLGLLDVDDVIGVLLVDVTKITSLSYNNFKLLVIFLWALYLVFAIRGKKQSNKSKNITVNTKV